MAMIAAFDVVEVQRTSAELETMSRPAVLRRRAIPENDPAWLALVNTPVTLAVVPEQERLDMEAMQASSFEFIDGRDVRAGIAVRRPR